MGDTAAASVAVGRDDGKERETKVGGGGA
ncbi:hypothetical protein A2U01_0086515, partial [Trifolium medium]|nr:hypothetical protein [Trifolium medium]